MSFVADDTSELPNPERGFYVRLQPNEFCNGVADDYISGANPYSAKLRLFEYEFNLANTAADVTANGASSQLARDFACARARGIKAELLPDYCTSQYCTEGYTQAEVVAHLRAIKPVLRANADVIAYAQFGIIGAWGETYDSGSGLDYVTPRTSIQEAYLDALPPEVMISAHMIAALVTQHPTPTTLSEAFNLSGTNPDSTWRVGYANYAFMGSSNDYSNLDGPLQVSNNSSFGGDTGWSTTLNRLQLRQWLAAQSEFTPFITEMDNRNDGTQRTGCTGLPGGVDSAHPGDGLDGAGQQGGILAEGPRYHLISTNRAFNLVFHSQWLTDGCYDFVNNHLGYRIAYSALSHAERVSRGGSLAFHLELMNTGWARHLIERHVQVVLSSPGAADLVCTSSVDLRLLPAQASTATPFDFTCQIPANATAGTWAVSLKLPDKSPALQSTRLFTVRPANADTQTQAWDDVAGTFSTGSSVRIE